MKGVQYCTILIDCECGSRVPCPGYTKDSVEYAEIDADVKCPGCGMEYSVEWEEGLYLKEMPN